MRNINNYLLKSSIPLLFATMFVVGMVSCKKTPEYVKYIPVEASFVLAFNMQSMTTKAVSWTDLFNTNFFKDLAPNKDKKMAQKIRNSGLNFLSTAYFFGNLNATQKDKNYVAALFQISSQADFEKFVSTANENEKPQIQEIEGVKYAMMKDAVVSWEGKTGLIVANTKNYDAKQSQQIAQNIRKNTDGGLIGKNKQFQEIQEASFDIAFWAHLGDFNKEFKDATSMYLALFDLTLTDHFITSTTNFEKGKINTQTKYHFPEIVAQEYKKLFKREIDAKTTQNTPITNPLVFMGFAMDMEYIKESLKKTGFDGMADKQANSVMGVSAADMMNVFSGDFIAALKDVKITEETVETINPETGEPDAITEKRPLPNLILSIGLNQKSILDKILKNFSEGETKYLQKKDDIFVVPISSNQNLYIIAKEKVAYLTNDEMLKNSLTKNNPEKLNNKAVELTKNSYLSFGMDMQESNISKVPQEYLKDYGLEKANPIEYINLKSPMISGNIATFEVNIDMKNKSQNAMRTLIEEAKKLADRPQDTSKAVQ